MGTDISLLMDLSLYGSIFGIYMCNWIFKRGSISDVEMGVEKQ
jgi:hypothetical protein